MEKTLQNLQTCIERCWQCRHACQTTLFDHCLKMGGKHAAAEHVKLMLECIEVCQVAADFMAQHSKFHPSVCAACADICEACAESCAAFPDAKMQACAQACHHSAEACRSMNNVRLAA